MGRQGFLPVIESCRRIAIHDIAGNDLLRDGCEWDSRISWPSNFTIEAQCRLAPDRPDFRTLRIKYQVRDYNDDLADVDEFFNLQRFPQPFGGYRWFFICPTSNRRCRVLYQVNGGTRFRSRWGFRCRLQYQSQRLAPMHRYQHGAAQTAKRVLRKGPSEWQAEFADYDFPPKPPWMRWKTYDRLDERAQAYDQAADNELLWRVRGLLLQGEGAEDMARRILGSVSV